MSCHLWRRLTPKNWGRSRLPLAPGKVKAEHRATMEPVCAYRLARRKQVLPVYPHNDTWSRWLASSSIRTRVNSRPSSKGPKCATSEGGGGDLVSYKGQEALLNQVAGFLQTKLGWGIGFFCEMDSMAECHSHGPRAVTLRRKNNVQQIKFFISLFKLFYHAFCSNYGCDASGKLWAGVSQTNGMAVQLLEYWISDKANTKRPVRKSNLNV